MAAHSAVKETGVWTLCREEKQVALPGIEPRSSSPQPFARVWRGCV